MSRVPTTKLAVLVSGGGTTLQNLIDKSAVGTLDATIDLVVASDANAGALARAARAAIPAAVVQAKGRTVPDYSAEIFALCRERRVELVLLAGFLKLVQIPSDFQWRVLNIHPALIPSFCGHGFHGRRVHEAALERGVKISGCTVHFADNEYDQGPIIVQRAVPVLEEDTPETLAARVFEAECEAYPEAIRLFAAGRLQVEGRRTRVRPAP